MIKLKTLLNKNLSEQSEQSGTYKSKYDMEIEYKGTYKFPEKVSTQNQKMFIPS